MKDYYSLMVAAGLILTGCQTEKKQEKTSQLPNIVIMVADDLGRNHLGAYGHPNIPTPNLDYLASQGMRFTNAYCTSASCSASRSVILTGLYNHATGQYGHTHHFHHFSTFDNVISLSRTLKDNGYVTGRIGKYHVAPEEIYPFDSVVPGNSRNGFQMALRSKSFIESADKPFFLYFCTDDPHRGGGKAEEIPTQPDRFGNKPPGDEYEGIVSRTYNPDEVIVPEYLPDTPATRDELAQYYKAVDRMDQGFGKLFEVLKEAGQWENTIILFMSDNGIAFPGAKTNLYDPAMRLPFLFYYPSMVEEGSVSDAMINWTYITPTLLDILGLLPEDNSIPGTQEKDGDYPWWEFPAVNETYHGKSFKTALEGNPEGFDEINASHTFHEITMYYPMRVVQDRKYKLIWNIASGLQYPHAADLWESSTWQSVSQDENNLYGRRTIHDYLHRAEFELYDMENDPHETRNLAAADEYAYLLQEYMDKLKQFQQETNDPWVVKWTYE